MSFPVFIYKWVGLHLEKCVTSDRPQVEVYHKSMALTIWEPWQLLLWPETGDTDLVSFRGAEKDMEYGEFL